MPDRAPAARPRPSADARLPASPFFSTVEQHVALARERFFDEGVRPSGLVPELVIQSWTRCVGARREPHERVAFQPVTKARIASVLDLSTEGEKFRFDAAAMVRLHATTIENRLLEAQSREQLLLRFQCSPALLHTPLEGLAAIDGAGRLCRVNGAGSRLLAGAPAGADALTAEQMFGLDLDGLLALAHGERVQAHRAPGRTGPVDQGPGAREGGTAPHRTTPRAA